MRFETWDRLDERVWPEAREIYREAFPTGKPERVIERAFALGIGLLHTATADDGRLVAMALTGLPPGAIAGASASVKARAGAGTDAEAGASASVKTRAGEEAGVSARSGGSKSQGAGVNALLIDYIAVLPSERGRGVGALLVEAVKTEARRRELDGLIIEVESDPEPANLARIRFWERCGFRTTDYVHQYIWVPEPYRAMALSFDEAKPLPSNGVTLFKEIGGFHSLVFRGAKSPDEKLP